MYTTLSYPLNVLRLPVQRVRFDLDWILRTFPSFFALVLFGFYSNRLERTSQSGVSTETLKVNLGKNPSRDSVGTVLYSVVLNSYTAGAYLGRLNAVKKKYREE